MAENKQKYEERIDILIQKGKISKIAKEIEEKENAKIIDGTNKICMPGFINAHTHLSMSIFRESVDGCNLQEWLNEKIWPKEAKLKNSDIYYASLLSFIEMIETGTVMANDQYWMAEDTIKAANVLGVRLQTTRTMSDVGDMGAERIHELEALIEEFNGKYENITLNVGIHGLYTTGIETVKSSIEVAKKYNLPVHMHFCENTKETFDIKNDYNVVSPVDVLEENFKNTHNILAHVVKVTDEEILRLSKMDISVVHCPVSNLRLGCGVAKIKKMQDARYKCSLRNRRTRKWF